MKSNKHKQEKKQRSSNQTNHINAIHKKDI